ncbi:hypothetical protein Btru_023178 [Bulinus truncatus]|nr:hypothetical protein Btru_023178 [Bulinus truncatus]
MDVSNDVSLPNDLSFGVDFDALLGLPANISQISSISEDFSTEVNNFATNYEIPVCSNCPQIKLSSQCEQHVKTIQNLTSQIDKMNRDSDILSHQLESLLKEMRPLKEEKQAFEDDLCKKSEEISRLKDIIESNEASLRQKKDGEEKSKILECELTVLKKQKATIVSKLTLTESKLWDLKQP